MKTPASCRPAGPTRRASLGLAATLALAAVRPAGAQEAAVRLLVGAAGGTGIDLAARGFAAPLAEALGRPVVVVNRPSAGGILAAEAVARAVPDGLTLLYSSIGPLAIAPQVVRPLPYHPLADFTHVARLACAGFALAVPAASPAQDIPGLVALLRQKGEAANFGTNTGSPAFQLAGALLLHAAGLRVTHVGYRGAAEAMVALSSGQLDFMVELRPLLQPQAQAGRVRLLAVTGPEPDPGLPDLPLLRSFYPSVVMDSWTGLSAPRDLPPPLAAALEGAARTAMQDAALQALLVRAGAVAAWLPGAEFTGFVATEVARMAEVASLTDISRG